MEITALETPLGFIEISVDDHRRLTRLDVVEAPSVSPLEGRSRGPGGVAAALRAYFGGDLEAIDSIAVEPERGTDFQRTVWSALRTIPAGATWSYRELAEAVGRPRGFRAVGQANGRNPTGIVVPCHRVVAADGGLGGYAGGLDRKRWLLDHEAAHT